MTAGLGRILALPANFNLAHRMSAPSSIQPVVTQQAVIAIDLID